MTKMVRINLAGRFKNKVCLSPTTHIKKLKCLKDHNYQSTKIKNKPGLLAKGLSQQFQKQTVNHHGN